tara:strand:+ start:75 stop:263 length:189 start_codon:yes stop_codon:yes gene_type:complete
MDMGNQQVFHLVTALAGFGMAQPEQTDKEPVMLSQESVAVDLARAELRVVRLWRALFGERKT